MREVIAVFPMYLFHHGIGTVAFGQVDKPVGSRVVATRSYEKNSHEFSAAFFQNAFCKKTLDQVLPFVPHGGLERAQLFPRDVLFQINVLQRLSVFVTLGQIINQTVHIEC
ncbi:hypothetical protein D3C87_1480060 [compost metagenome]